MQHLELEKIEEVKSVIEANLKLIQGWVYLNVICKSYDNPTQDHTSTYRKAEIIYIMGLPKKDSRSTIG